MKGLLPECWRHVFSFLGPCALLNCASVSHGWCALARDERVWARHACRVREQLGEFCDEVEHQTWPTWQRFARHLLRAEAGLSQDGTFSQLAIRSLFEWIPTHWVLKVTYSYRVDTCSIRIPDYENQANFGTMINVGPDVKSLAGQLQTGEFFRVNGSVKPLQLGRFHRIVRDSDCQAPVEHCFWFRIER
jgi:hypothetical protein